jgi:hypothetical protein
VNKIMKCRKSEVGTSYLYRPQLVWFDLVRWFLYNSVIFWGQLLYTYRKTTLHAQSWFLFLINFLTQTPFSSPFPNKVDISLTTKTVPTRTPACITFVDAILSYTGIQWTCLHVNISLNSCCWNSSDLHWIRLTSVNEIYFQREDSPLLLRREKFSQ